MQQRTSFGRMVGALLLVWLLAMNLAAQEKNTTAAQQQPPPARLRVTTELVLVNVVVRDKKGNPIADLKQGDFTLYEDGQKQQISSFDFENVNELQMAGTAGPTINGKAAESGTLLTPKVTPSLEAKDRRLMLFFFDFSAMEPDDIDRAVDAAKKFVQTKMQPPIWWRWFRWRVR